MGAGGSTTLQVDFDHPNLLYIAGEPIKGNVSFQNSQDKLTVDGIFLEFIGELGYTAEEIRQNLDNNGNPQKQNRTENHVVPFINIRIPVIEPQYGQVKNFSKIIETVITFFFIIFFLARNHSLSWPTFMAI